MRIVAVRLAGAADLKQELLRVATENLIGAGVILSAAGGLKKAHGLCW